MICRPTFFLSFFLSLSFSLSDALALFVLSPFPCVSLFSKITQMSLKHPVDEGQISSKKMPKSHANTMTLSLRSTKNRLQRRPPAALRGFRIQVTVKNLF